MSGGAQTGEVLVRCSRRIEESLLSGVLGRLSCDLCRVLLFRRLVVFVVLVVFVGGVGSLRFCQIFERDHGEETGR